jgi:hypothetical protein
VQLAVYDVNGRLIKSVTYANKNAGHHQHRFDFSDINLSTGVYLLQLNAAGQVRNQKICHIK